MENKTPEENSCSRVEFHHHQDDTSLFENVIFLNQSVIKRFKECGHLGDFDVNGDTIYSSGNFRSDVDDGNCKYYDISIKNGMRYSTLSVDIRLSDGDHVTCSYTLKIEKALFKKRGIPLLTYEEVKIELSLLFQF